MDIEFPEKTKFLFEDGWRYYVLYGGRGSAKSWSMVRAIILMAIGAKHRILCVREIQGSIRESVHKLICDQIEEMGLNHFFRITNNSIESKNGSEFIFTGIKSDPAKVKSTEGVTICFIEEAHNISEKSWQILLPTIRTPGSKFFICFNTNFETDPTYKRFVIDPPSTAKVVKIDYPDNPWFPKELLIEAEEQLKNDPELYEHIWMGGIKTISDALIFNRKFKVDKVEPKADWSGPYFGSDFGFASDPTTLVKCWVNQNKLYIEREVVCYHVDTPMLPARFSEIKGSMNYVIRGDCSRPETISQLKMLGYRQMTSCKKWPGCVEDGIAFMRGFEEIIVDISCVETLKEFRYYSYKTDKLSGDIQPEILDKYNHCMDAIRYALEPLITFKRRATASNF